MVERVWRRHESCHGQTQLPDRGHGRGGCDRRPRGTLSRVSRSKPCRGARVLRERLRSKAGGTALLWCRWRKSDGGGGHRPPPARRKSAMLVSEGSAGGAWLAGPCCEEQGRVSATRPFKADPVGWMLGPGGGHGCQLRKEPSARVSRDEKREEAQLAARSVREREGHGCRPSQQGEKNHEHARPTCIWLFGETETGAELFNSAGVSR